MTPEEALADIEAALKVGDKKLALQVIDAIHVDGFTANRHYSRTWSGHPNRVNSP
jgi:hypothetical protein